MKTRIISGCKYTYEDNLLLVIMGSLLHKPGGSCYYDNGLFQKSLVSVRTHIGVCRLEIVSILTKLCPGAKYHYKSEVWQKESGLYQGTRLVYKVGGLHFKHIYHFGHIKSIDEEINFMLDCSIKHAESLLELLLQKRFVKKLHLTQTTKGLPRCHYPLLHNGVEYNVFELDYWQGRSDVLLSKVEMPRYYDN
jgi:hypothetical protein